MDLKIDLQQFAPKRTYLRNGMEHYLDPFRKMLVPCTPETLLFLMMETYIHKVMGVPKNMMYMNQSLRKYGMDSSKMLDIVIHDKVDHDLKPIAIVEFRTPDKPLNQVVTTYIEDFAKRIGVNCLLVTNGDSTNAYISREDRRSYWKIDKVPNYNTICKAYRDGLAALAAEKAAEEEVPSAPVRRGPKAADQSPKFNPKTTPDELKPLIAAFISCFGDGKTRLKPRAFGALTLVGDCGLRRKLNGFGSEKVDKTLHRTFMIKDFYDNHQLVSFDISPDLKGAPVLSVTLDDEDNRQVILAIDLNNCLKSDEQRVSLTYDIKKAFPKESREFLDEFMKFVTEKTPHLVTRQHINFGEVGLPENLKVDDAHTAELLFKIITFALRLDEYRENIKTATRELKKSAKTK